MEVTNNQTGPVSGSDMADVDRSENPQARVNYLDAVTEQLLERKIDTYSTLGINGGDRVLDVGCGTGDDVQRMAAIVGPSGRAVGVDASETMIERARERAKGLDHQVEFIQADAYDLPFPDDSFDACRCERVLQHLDNPLRAMNEMVRVTRPGGRILLMDPDFGGEMFNTSHPEIHERIRDFEQRQRRTEPGSGWRGRQLWGLAHQAGLENVQVDGGIIVLTSYVAANALAGIETGVNGAVDAGAISRPEADAYLDDLRDRDSSNRFLAAAPGFFVLGTVPE